MPKMVRPGEDSWAELREAQSMARRLPNTGMAVLIDIGETKEIHPRNKKDAGERLAAIALARDYGKKIPFEGPAFDSMKIEGDTVVVSSEEVPRPVAVRYAWAKNPTCNLYNKAGFPAEPFRTDDFPAVTFDKKF
ncbi:MAG: hypothetical protein LBK99_01210 [Opitutaceae bacterium]|nr:hypothetical protein [Opitutaceae bacterium]